MSKLVYAPIAMSFAILALLVAERIFKINPLPIHDEGALDHIGMLLYWGQLPLIGFYGLRNFGHLRKIVTRLLVPAILFATVTMAVYRTEELARGGVAQRIAANQPLVGSAAALRQAVIASGSPAPTSLTFKGVDKIGWDIYDAEFADGTREWRIFVTPDGKAAGVTQFDAEHRCRSTEPYECR